MRSLKPIGVALVAALVAVPAAAAHVTVNPSEAAADSFARFDLRVPNETEDADTVSVSIELPAGLEDVGFQPKPGWTRTVEGTTVTWAGGTIAPGEFDEFGFSAHVPAEAGTVLEFPASQEYSNGETVRWIGAEDSEEPAPRVTLTAAAAAGEEEEDDDGDDGIALWLAIVGIVLGGAALAVAVAGKIRRT
jgi:uncharacterized protein YcnI